jgi:hypothetical protein
MLIPISSSASARFALHLTVRSAAAAAVHALAAQEHVVVDAQFVDQREVLVDVVDPERAGVVDAFRLVGLARAATSARRPASESRRGS